MTTKAAELRSVLERSISSIASRTTEADRCLILSGGVDTCAILAAASRIGVTFPAAYTVVTADDDDDDDDERSPDLRFAAAAAAEHGIAEHRVLRIGPDELVDTYLPDCVQALGTFDGMTLRNSLVVAAAFRAAAEGGYKHAVVGDGADELFGGYSFMWGCEDDPVKWREKRDSMCKEWTFATEDLAALHGLRSHSPYMEPVMVEWAIRSTGREDCIGTRPIRLVRGGKRVEHITGKVILREAYDTVASWRRKDPIEVGSGITVIGHNPYWADIISDTEYKRETNMLLKRGFVIKSKEYLVNYRAFEKYFSERDGAWNHPTRKRLPVGEGCAGCCFEIGDKTFCNICGAYPAQRT